MQLHILTTAHNVELYLERCLESLQRQNIVNWKCYIFNDASTDSTAEIARGFASKDARFEVIHNPNRLFQVNNYYLFHQRSDLERRDVVVNVDGDDYLPDPCVLERVVERYQNPNLWITWGSYLRLGEGKMTRGISGPIESMETLRQNRWVTSHLRTWRIFLFRAIRLEDLQSNDGKFWEVSGDRAIMYPMLEMAGLQRALYLPEINYIYNAENPLCEFRKRYEDQMEVDRALKNKTPYTTLGI